MKSLFTFVGFFCTTLLFGQTETITTAGAGTWTCPAGVTSVLVECWGGGGGSGGANSSAPSSGGGGAGGSYSAITIPVITGDSYDYEIGAGGSYGSSGAATIATAGGNTWFTSTATVMATGGAPGTNGAAGTSGTGGVGSTAGNIGTIIFRGGNGSDGTSSESGAGGGSAGSESDGGDASGITPGTGGTGGGVNGEAGLNFTSIGTSAFIPGGGASGGLKTSGFGGGKSGAYGGGGQLKITYNVALPIIFEYFNVNKADHSNLLQWKINNTENNTTTMTIERSLNGKQFDIIKEETVTDRSAGGTYTYNDQKCSSGINFYRVGLHSTNGKSFYSKTVVISNHKGTTNFSISPNPARTKAILQLNATQDDIVKITVTDLNGRILINKETRIASGKNDIEMDFASCNAGIYQISVQGNDYKALKSIQVIKD